MFSISKLRCITKILTVLLIVFPVTSVLAERIKDISKVEGVRSNQLIGYGLVVGLDGTGDGGSPFTSQSLKSMLKTF